MAGRPHIVSHRGPTHFIIACKRGKDLVVSASDCHVLPSPWPGGCTWESGYETKEVGEAIRKWAGPMQSHPRNCARCQLDCSLWTGGAQLYSATHHAAAFRGVVAWDTANCDIVWHQPQGGHVLNTRRSCIWELCLSWLINGEVSDMAATQQQQHNTRNANKV